MALWLARLGGASVAIRISWDAPESALNSRGLVPCNDANLLGDARDLQDAIAMRRARGKAKPLEWIAGSTVGCRRQRGQEAARANIDRCVLHIRVVAKQRVGTNFTAPSVSLRAAFVDFKGFFPSSAKGQTEPIWGWPLAGREKIQVEI